MVDRKSNIIEANLSFQELVGYSQKELIGMNYNEITPSEWKNADKSMFKNQLLPHGYSDVYEKEFIRKDGSRVPVEMRTFLYVDEQQKSAGAWAIVRDITERKKAEKELVKSENLLRNFLEEVMEGIIILDPDGTVVFWNNVTSILTDISSTEAMGKFWWDLTFRITPDEFKTESYLHKLENMLKIELISDSQKYSRPDEIRIKRTDGIEVLIERRIFPVKTMTGIQYAVTILNITEKKHAEKLQQYALLEMEKSENRFRSIIQGSSDMIFILDKEGILTYESPSVSKILGYDPGYFTGKSPYLLMHPDDYLNVYGKIKQISQSIHSGTPVEFRIKKSDGNWICLEFLGTNQYENPHINGIVLTIRDISERKRSENALRSSESELKSLLDSAPIGVGMLIDRKFKKVNRTLCKMTGYSEQELLDQPARKIYSDDNVYNNVGGKLYENMELEGIGKIETQFKRKDGNLIDIQLALSPFDKNDLSQGVCTTALDITERNRMERELRDSEEKFRSIYENMPLAYVRTDIKGNILDINPATIQILGFTDQDEAMNLLEGNVINIHSSDEDIYNIISDLLQHTGIKKYTKQMKKKDGSMFTASLIMKMTRLKNGEPAFRPAGPQPRAGGATTDASASRPC